MASLSEFLKGGIKTARFSRHGAILEPAAMTNRIHTLNVQRKEQRHSLILRKRHIPKEGLSPFNSPTPAKKKTINDNNHNDEPQKNTTNQKPIMQDRIQLLKKWQEEKKKRMDKEKKNSKPLFKVYHVSSIENSDLSKVYGELKGKPIQTKAKNFQLAPTASYLFKAPANIKPIQMNNKSSGVRTRSQLKFLNTPIKKSTNRPTTLSSGRSGRIQNINSETLSVPSTSGMNVVPTNNKKSKSANNRRQEFKEKNFKVNKVITENEKTENVINNKSKQKTTKSSKSALENSPAQPIKSKKNIGKKPSVVRSKNKSLTDSLTPAKNNDDNSSITPETKQAVTYVSPYITVSRGKDNARKEYHSRSFGGETKDLDGSICGKEDYAESTSIKAAVPYFRNLLNNQISHLQSLCNHWNSYKETENPAEEVCDMINVAIGQTDLLLSKKFKQFSSLINVCETRSSEKPVTCLDLHGYWDTVKIQIANLEKRFDNLESLRNNNWEEILPAPVKPKIKVKSKAEKVKPTRTTSILQAAIREARKKRAAMKLEDSEQVIFTSSSPKTPRSRRSSLRRAVFRSESKQRISSPGLTVMRVTQVAKSADKVQTLDNQNTPSDDAPRSILKSQNRKSTLRKSKIVLFKQGSEESTIDNEENDANVSNLITFSPNPTVQTPRRSSRLQKGLIQKIL